MPPIARTENTAPTRSTPASPVYGTSLISRMPDSTMAMIDDLERERRRATTGRW